VGVRVHGKETEPVGAGGCVGQLKARHHNFFFLYLNFYHLFFVFNIFPSHRQHFLPFHKNVMAPEFFSKYEYRT